MDLYKSKDLRQFAHRTWISVEPAQLRRPNIPDRLRQKLMGLVDARLGFILAIEDIQVLDNVIGEKGHVEVLVTMLITSVLPKVGMQFSGTIMAVLPDGCIVDNKHFQNLLVGGHYSGDGYLNPCGCLLRMGSRTVAEIAAVSFQRGKYTCICKHIC